MKSHNFPINISLKTDEMHHDHHSDSEIYTGPMNSTHEKRFTHTKRQGYAWHPHSEFKESKLAWFFGAIRKLPESIQRKAVKNSRQTTVSFIFGLVVGVTLTAMLFQHKILISSSKTERNSDLTEEGFIVHTSPEHPDSVIQVVPDLKTVDDEQLLEPNPGILNNLKFPTYKDKNIKNDIRTGSKIYVGVITAELYLSTRSVAVNSTWGSQADKISFFTEKGTPEEYGIPVINLDGVSDKEYPPQKKAFHMLKYMCENHIDEYDWFIRSDDDVYIRVEKLKQFLSQIDSNKMIYMGQPGHGVPEVRDRLGLNGHNFCMGGPSVIFNKKAMRELCPHMDECMAEVVSGEEDVELGRCVSKHLHIECTHAWESLKLFYHSYQEEYTEEKPFLGNLAENIHVEKAITLHHVKVPYIMYKIHRHYMSLLLNSSTQSILYLREQAHTLNTVLPFGKHRELSPGKISPDPYKAEKQSEVAMWKSFNVESLFSLSYANPSEDITNDCLADLKQIGETAIDVAIDHGAPHLTYSHMAGGYYRSDSLRGTDYFLDIYLSSKEQGKQDEVKRVHFLRPLSDLQVSDVERFDGIDSFVSVFVVLALDQSAASASDLEDYMRKQYEQIGLQSTMGQTSRIKTTLIVAVYGENNADAHEPRNGISPTIQDVVNWFRVRYPQSNIEAIPRLGNSGKDAILTEEGYSYNARQAYTKGTLHAIKLWDNKGKGVILLSSANFTLSKTLIETCTLQSTLKTIQEAGENDPNAEGAHFYQPVPFSLFSSRESYEVENLPSEGTGYWFLSSENHSGDLNLPICGSIHNFISVTNYMQTDPNQNVIKSIYDSIYNFRYFLQRVPDKNIMSRKKR